MKNFKFILMILFLLFISNLLRINNSKPKLIISKEQHSYNFDTSLLKIFSLGQNRLIADFLWITTLINGDLEHVEKEKKSWMYYRFLTISELSPYFYENYLYGGIYLSVIKDDIRGAKTIYEKGLLYYPNDFWINYNSAFNDFFELGLKKDAILKYKKVLNLPEAKVHSRYLPSLVARLEADTGGIEEAFIMLYSNYLSTSEGAFKDKLHTNLYSLKAEIDLGCLNSLKKNCKMIDFDGKEYLKIKGKYKASKGWKKFRTYKKRGTN